MSDPRSLLERESRRFIQQDGAFERLARRRDRKRRNQRIRAGLVGIVVFVAAVWIVTSVGSLDRTQTPADPGGAETGPAVTEPTETAPAETEPTAAGADPKTDFLLDLDTGKMTQLPESIVGTEDGTAGYAVSPDGSEVAYYGHAEDGSVQVFVANLDGTHVRQITDNAAATMLWSGSPGWSPDGTRIAYVGHRTGDFTGRGFVIDLASGVTTQVTSDSEEVGSIQFSPDGSSILYTTWVPSTSGPPFVDHRVRIVPLTGGEASTLVSGDRTWDGWGGPTEARLSPDGSLLSYLCGNSSDDVLDLCVATPTAPAPGCSPRERS